MSRLKVRQGDVLIEKIDMAPEGKRKVREDGALAYGEVTGHSHRVDTLTKAAVYECGEGLFLSVSDEGGVAIVHEEHKPIQVPKGDYRITIQREYTPEVIRNVAD
jgi:hypothetical protein